MSKSQIEHLAGVAKQEQGSVEGAKAELSLMANRFESQSKYSTINSYVRDSGWFASSSKNKTTSEKKYVNAVKDVLVKGNRTLPPSINEHDMLPGDIASATNHGVNINVSNRAAYKQGVTVIRNIYGSTYTFYCFPTPHSDPFGYTNSGKYNKWEKKYAVKGELYYKSNKSPNDVATSVQAKIAYYGPTYEEKKKVKKTLTFAEAQKNGNINSSLITPENANKTWGTVTVTETVTTKRKYKWSGHGNPQDDVKKGKLVCAAPPSIPFGTKIKISGTGTEYDGKEFTVKDRLDETKVKNGKYYVALLVKDYKKKSPSAWLNGKVTYENPNRESNYGAGGEEEEGTLQVSPETLYTSNNYAYIMATQEATETTLDKLRKTVKEGLLETIRKMASQSTADEASSSGGAFGANEALSNAIKDALLNFKAINLLSTPSKVVSRTMVSGSTNTSVLPVVSVAVEAPYFELDISGVKFGGYHNKKIPNYVRSLTVRKINGSINEYSISLIHQIRPGDNPNYIDNILSAQGFNYISLKYGNANTGQIFRDQKALITNVAQTFDFTSCNIVYNISATSIAAETAAQRYNFSEYEGKLSDRIRWLLYESVTDILDIFPGMASRAEVEKLGLIPTNDKSVVIGAQTGVTAINYLLTLVERMENASMSIDDELTKSVYMLTVNDSNRGSSFRITEVTSNVSSIPFMYEVNVGYPDDNFVMDFSVKDNFAWAVAYEGSKKIVKYDYEIDSLGNLERQRVPAYYQEDEDILGFRNLWSSLTRFPINATLTVRGLLQDSLLMQYIKVNCIMYGAKRITSGVYIVTEQEDSIGNGVYSTTLTLMRVAGDEEYINLDGRKIT